jgi:nitrogen regulatory protein PII
MDYATNEYRLIITIVNRGYGDQVVGAARSAGAKGGTVIIARGSGIHETEKFMDISITPEKEMVLIIVQRKNAKVITKAILDQAGLKTPGRGISFTVPVTDVVGITSQLAATSEIIGDAGDEDDLEVETPLEES